MKNKSIYTLLSKEEKIKKGITDEHIVSLVDSLLFNAIRLGASDIHLQPTFDNMRIRYRIDGVLYDQDYISSKFSLPVLSRLKILSSLNIAEKRIPQDGKFRLTLDSTLFHDSFNKRNFIDLRISTFPSIYGEKMVIRILDKMQNWLKLNQLGFNFVILQNLYNLLKKSYGFFLITGPTGSGKTTTLYAILSELNDNERNIVTMEDPVEYDINGITQSQINEKAGFTFERGLRSVLRQDPDVIMVGEIRDKQTAQIAIEASLTGHLVFSTLHTQDSVGAITRLIDMGIEPFLINASLCGVLAQRLVRKLCTKCKVDVNIDNRTKDLLKNNGIFNYSKSNIKNVYTSLGCKNCFDLGYKGRTGIFELLIIDDDIRSLCMAKPSIEKIRQRAIKNGLQSLFSSGISKVNSGVISLEELLRVIN